MKDEETSYPLIRRFNFWREFVLKPDGYVSIFDACDPFENKDVTMSQSRSVGVILETFSLPHTKNNSIDRINFFRDNKDRWKETEINFRPRGEPLTMKPAIRRAPTRITVQGNSNVDTELMEATLRHMALQA